MSAASAHHRIARLGRGAGEVADVVLVSGKIYTGASAGQARFASAIAVRDGRVLAIGDDDDVEGHRGDGTEVVDLAGRTVVPGLIDSHTHLVRAGLTWTEEVVWYEVPTLAEGLALLSAAADRAPAGTWLRVVGGWHPGQFAENREPTREELSDAFPDHPVYVQLLYESGVLNDAGLAAAGITRDTEDPALGTFERDAGGEPTGTVRGIGAFMHVLGHFREPTHAEKVQGTREHLELLNRWGITGAIDAGGIGVPPESYEALFDLWRDGGLTLRTRLYTCPVTRGGEAPEVMGWLRHSRPGFGDAWLRHVGMGEVVVFGCHDLEGLTDFTVTDETKDELEMLVREIAERRSPLHMHAVLDDTASAILDVWERVAADHDLAALRWSLAHVEPISARNLDRIARLGIGIAVQDRLVYRAAASASVWGDDAVRSGPPLRDILDRDIPLGGGTDATRVASPNPWVSLWWLVTGRTFDEGPHRDAEQCLTRVEALDAYTRGSAWFSFEEHERGHLSVGSVADLAVLDDDYFEIDDDAIRHLASDLTMVDGRVVHAAGPFAGLAF